MIIQWTAPSDQGSPITAYRIQVKLRAGEFDYEEQLDYCDGTSAQIVEDGYCTVLMSVFGDAPYLLFIGDHIYAQVLAINYYGESDYSQVGGGATYKTEPDSPFNL